MSHKKIRAQEYFRKQYQKKWVQRLMSTLMVVFLPFVGFYIHFIEPRLVKTSSLKIPIKKLPGSFNLFRIVQMSDLHYGPTNNVPSFFKKCIQKVNELKPDLVALTGDYLQWDDSYLKGLANILAGLKAKSGIFAVLGNHDYGVCHKGHPPTDPIDHEDVIEAFEKRGINVLHNRRIPIRRGGETLEVVGVGDYWTSHFLPEKALRNRKPPRDKSPRDKSLLRGKPHPGIHYPTILLCHNPDSIDHLKDFHFDLMLSGHVHGGQISLPFIGPLSVPVKNRHLRRGLHRIGPKWLYTNRGLGFIFKARMLSRPEITCFDLIPA